MYNKYLVKIATVKHFSFNFINLMQFIAHYSHIVQYKPIIDWIDNLKKLNLSRSIGFY